MKDDTIELKAPDIEVPKNPAENYRKTLFNYDLEIANAISRAEFFSAREELYRDDTTKKGKQIYYGAVVNLRKLQTYLIALKKGKNEAWKRLEEIIDRYKPKKKKIWFMYFINGYTINEIAEKTYYEQRQLKRIIKSMREELITYLPYQDLKDNEIIEGDDKDEN